MPNRINPGAPRTIIGPSEPTPAVAQPTSTSVTAPSNHTRFDASVPSVQPPSNPRPAQATRPTLAPSGASEAQKFAHYARIVLAAGGEVNPNGMPTVLGLRGLSADGQPHPTNTSRAYDDVFVVLTPDGRVRELPGATHPGNTRSNEATDVDGDGQGDVGMIRPGSFLVVPHGNRFGGPSYAIQTRTGSGALPGWRDTKHDGTYDEGTRASAELRGDKLTGVLFHQDIAFSIGCQTLAPEQWKTFVEAVGGPKKRFTYTLVAANN